MIICPVFRLKYQISLTLILNIFLCVKLHVFAFDVLNKQWSWSTDFGLEVIVTRLHYKMMVFFSLSHGIFNWQNNKEKSDLIDQGVDDSLGTFKSGFWVIYFLVVSVL